VMNELRQEYFILSARAAVRSCWSSCQQCKLWRSKPRQPEMAPLPDCRVTRPERPFTFTGIDYFGPMEVKVRRAKEKRYGVIFTCLSTRAVHLEIASSLTTNSAIMAIRRFMGRRGHPQKIFSDNGRNLRGVERELRQAVQSFDQEKIMEELTKRKVEWSFIPPGAPHMGGSWERLVRSVKAALRVTLTEQSPREEVLNTLFVEAENIINSRPLTHVPVDPNDPDSLTPNSFLLGTSSAAIQVPSVFVDSSRCPRKQWILSQKLADHFWSRWVKEYLPSLTRRTKWHRTSEPVKVGDLVIIADNNLHRNHWPRGVVSAVHPGRDGVVRVVDVKTNAGVYRRPVVKLCVLDIEQSK
jgi:transposase InsO family protein